MKKLCVHLFLLVLLVSSCATKRKGESVSSVKQNALQGKQLLEYNYLFFDANKHKMLGNYERAAGLFLECLKISNADPAPAYEAAYALNMLDKKEEALVFATAAAKRDKQNIWYQLLYAELLQKNNDFQTAVAVYNQLIDKNPDRIDFYYALANAYLYLRQPEKAIEVFDKVEKRTGITEEVSVQKQKLYIKLGKVEQAAAELQKLIDDNPKEIKYYNMLADLYQVNGFPEKAFEVNQKILEADPENPYVHLSLADYYRDKGEKEKSFQELKAAFSNNQLDIDTKVKILLSYFTLSENSEDMKKQAYELCELLISVHPNEAKAFAMYGDFLTRDKKYDQARTQYRKAIELDKSRFALWSQLLTIEEELKDYKALVKEGSEAIELFPDQPVLYLLNGFALIQEKKYQEAIDVLNEGRTKVVENDALLAQFYSNLGDAANYLKDYPRSDEYYDKALELDPKNVYVLNNYSYYLSLRGEDLDKAEKMSALTNQLEPNNSSYQDTYAWILYKQAKYKEAKEWLEKAMNNGASSNAVILEHYGDVLFKLGDEQKALEYWQNAKSKGKGSDLLERKIAEKKLIE